MMRPTFGMMRPKGPTIAAFACAAIIGLLYVSPVLKDVMRTGLDWPIWIDHAEGHSLTTYGKWWVLPPHQYLSDGSSGEFPVYIYYISDSLLNGIAEALHAPPMAVQAVLYGPALGMAFLLLNYFSIAAVVRDRWVALGASLLLSLGGNSTFLDHSNPVTGLALNTVIHVPFHVISLGTAQSLGWVLLLPCFSLAYLAYHRFGRCQALGAGILLGLLFHTHTLTFVNVSAALLAYLVLENALGRLRDRHFWVWIAALWAIVAAFAFLALTRPVFPFSLLVGLGVLALTATFLLDPNKRFYLWTFGAAAVVSLPYAVHLARHARSLTALQETWSQVMMTAVGLAGFALFFAGYCLAAALGYIWTRDRSVLVWVSALLVATSFLAVNHLWNWSNHPYRFVIHLLFPLAILAALGLRHAPRPLAAVLGAWLGAVCLFDVGSFALDRPVTVRFRVGDDERASFLETVRDVTKPLEGTGARLLAPVEVAYPRGLVQASMILNYSRIPTFVPDYRHILWRERYHNRLGLFCFIFPSYPNADFPFGRRGCEEDLDPEPELVVLRDPRLRTSILPVYGIGFAAALGKPFSIHLEAASPLYGWPVLTRARNSVFVRTNTPAQPGVARLDPGTADPATLQIRVTPDAPGPHLVILGGRQLSTRAPRIDLDGRPLQNGRRSPNWAVFEAELCAGPHTLELPSHESGAEPEAEYLYFAAVVRRDVAERYLGVAHQ